MTRNTTESYESTGRDRKFNTSVCDKTELRRRCEESIDPPLNLSRTAFIIQTSKRIATQTPQSSSQMTYRTGFDNPKGQIKTCSGHWAQFAIKQHRTECLLSAKTLTLILGRPQRFEGTFQYTALRHTCDDTQVRR